MSLLKIHTVEKSKDGKRTYGRTLLGKVMFPFKSELELKAGAWAVVTPQRQTKKYDEKGVLQPIPFDEQPTYNIVQAVFDDKQKAITAIVEEQAGGDFEVAKQMADFAKVNGLDINALKELAGAAV